MHTKSNTNIFGIRLQRGEPAARRGRPRAPHPHFVILATDLHPSLWVSVGTSVPITFLCGTPEVVSLGAKPSSGGLGAEPSESQGIWGPCLKKLKVFLSRPLGQVGHCCGLQVRRSLEDTWPRPEFTGSLELEPSGVGQGSTKRPQPNPNTFLSAEQKHNWARVSGH